MNILIVGGLGYIGFELLRPLVSAGHHVTVLDVNYIRVPQAQHQKVQVVTDTVENLCPGSFLENVDCAINLTGGVDDQFLYGTAHATSGPQVLAPLLVREACPKAKIVHVSTQFVYSGGDLFKERSKEIPACPYGLVHLMAEQALRSGETDVILRFGTVWGKATFPRWDTWINRLFWERANNGCIDIYNSTILTSTLHMSNAVKAILWSVEGPPGTYNIADYVGYKEDIVRLILKAYPYTARLPKEGISSGMDCSRARKAGFSFDEVPFEWWGN